MKKFLLSLLMLCAMTAALAQDDDFVNVDTTEKLWNAIKDNDHAKVRLTADFALSDIDKDYELYCNGNTFYGTIDGNGHTIKGDPKVDVRARTYMFYNCSGATFKNLTFKGIRVNSQSNPNQAIITSKAQNGCVFENITFDNVHTFSDYDNAAAAAGWAKECTFTNITVKNSDFTVDDTQAGCVVGHAIGCQFSDIKVENCESTADDGKAGGVAGRSDNCTFNKVDVSGGEIEAKDDYAGGVCGYAEGSKFISCVNSANVLGDDCVGGILGYCTGTDLTRCTNSGTISHRAFYELLPGYEGLGGIVGQAESGSIEQCSNHGEYPSKDDPCGGIVGYAKNMTINNCLCTVAPTPYLTASETIAFGGIVGYCESCKVTNTLSTEYYVFGGVGNCKDMKSGSGNNFWQNYNNHQYNVELTSYEEEAHGLTTGHLTNILNNSSVNVFAGITPWEQNLGTDLPHIGDRGLHHARKIKNQYGTVCLPFPVKSDDRISYYKFGYSSHVNDDIVLTFNYLSDVPAGTPVLFYAPEVNDKASDESLVEVCFYSAGNDLVTEPYSDPFPFWSWRLEGTIFTTKVFEGEDAAKVYYISDNKIRNAQTTVIYPYHAYLIGPSIHELTAEARNITFSLEDEDGETTALELVGEDLVPVQQSGKSYSLMGTEVGEGYRGIVIKNGKKVVTVNN